MTKSSRSVPFWFLEDTSTYSEREAGSAAHRWAPVGIRLYRVKEGTPELVKQVEYTPTKEGSRSVKTDIVLRLLDDARVRSGVVVAGSRFMKGSGLLSKLTSRNIHFVMALPPEWFERPFTNASAGMGGNLKERLAGACWKKTGIQAPESSVIYEVASLGEVTSTTLGKLRCFALAAGGITGYRRSILVGATSLDTGTSLADAAALLGWTRWLRFSTRRADRSDAAQRRALRSTDTPSARDPVDQGMRALTARVNLTVTRKQDQRAADDGTLNLFDIEPSLHKRLLSDTKELNVVELFAGAGGMGLGFLRANGQRNPYRIIYSGELNPVFVQTLRYNHEFLRKNKYVDSDALPGRIEPVDLRASSAMHRIQRLVAEAGGASVVIGGPPCQGFSSANRNSWSSDNPNNQLVDTYIDYVVRLKPRVLIMENVQGIVWTPQHNGGGQLSVAGHVASRLSKAGYRIYPKMIDAAWYGVPQHRNRFFLIGIHADLGYAQDDFGSWGPYPQPTHGPRGSLPYVTVHDAIGDLPRISNGAEEEEQPYTPPLAQQAFSNWVRKWAPEGVIWDHVTSRHADYVIKRYNRISQGENWSSIEDMMTNYSDVHRTHSNIYRRLTWAEPSITIGHYRKAMLIHPSQDRGLSLREAARLQSFPDWYRFAGSADSVDGGLGNKQQQLANAVCPLVTRGVAEFLLKL